ncbi:hypothetical protein UFOVP344_25 [uncultured Caudovirales phage]|uniref:Scaffolding protein n=1 Tax=uncultured Caudovirales phage TaxID=2100421 RepID=A0A6J5LZQ6_9CAUD|nr:hypothetical protein UFOVP344_25 [uncultured Caudovirales phage]
MPTTHEGVDNEQAFDAESAFLKRWQDADLLSGGDEGADDGHDEGDEISPNDQSQDETQADDEDLDFDEGGEEGEEDEDGNDQNKVEAPDDALVTIKVGDETQTVAVKDLKRLFGQEAALTRKSQEVAQARQKVEAEAEMFVAASEKLLERAQKEFEPYKGIDWLVASKQLTSTEFASLRQEAMAKYENLRFLEEETTSVYESMKVARQAEQVEAAKKCIEVLSDTIPNWSKERYDSLRDFAATRGMSTEAFNSILDPVAISIINDAMTLQEARARAASKKKAVAPTKVMKKAKGRQTASGQDTQHAIVKEANRRLRETGSDEAAENAFMARWEAMDRD